jgi:tetratricopeptide (TPR) repeat protein
MFLVFMIFRSQFTPIPGHLSAGITHFDLPRLILTIAAFSRIIYLYFSKLLFPDFIIFGWNTLLPDKFFFIWIAGLLILLAGWYRLYKANSKSMSFFCATWMMIGFLPVTIASLSIPKLGLIIEPQWLTFSSIGFFLFIAWAGLRLYTAQNKKIVGVSFIFLVLILMSVTRFNNWIWQDEVRYYDFWQENIEGFNGSHGYDLTMGNIYLNKKNYGLARHYYLKVLRSGQPYYSAIVYSNLGLIDFRLGNLDQAKEEFLMSIKSNPNDPFALNNLAVIYKNQSNYKLAEAYLLRALALDKYSIESRLNLAYIYEKESKYKEAIWLYKQNLNIVPYEELSLLALVNDCLRTGDGTSVEQYSRLLIDHSRDPAYLTELGSVLAQSGLSSTASDAFSQAIRVDPRYKQAYLEGGKLLANSRKYSEAIRVWQIGESIDPKDPNFGEDIARAMVLRSNDVSH